MSAKNKNIKDNTTIIISIIALIISGISIYITFNQTNSLDKKRTALEAINITREENYLLAFARIHGIGEYLRKSENKTINHAVLRFLYEKDDSIKNLNCLIHDINFILNSFDYISVLYFSEQTNQDIIYKQLYYKVSVFNMAITELSLSNLQFEISISRFRFDYLYNEFESKKWESEKKYRNKTNRNYKQEIEKYNFQ